MESYDSNSFMVAWRRGDDTKATEKLPPGRKIKVGPWPDQIGWTDGLSVTGCCSSFFQEQPPERKAQLLVNLFVDLVLGYGLNPAEVQQEFMKIDIWRDMNIDLPSGRYMAHQKGLWSPYNP
ncbi:MAG: hypothetical protein JNM75_03830 [Rhodospirillales bacterium]|nr:hypothetical protein [Rhodospirillales bacterium]